jgi:hypothetical protein
VLLRFALVMVCCAGCEGRGQSAPAQPPSARPPAARAAPSAALPDAGTADYAAPAAQCGGCHAPVRASSLPRARWRFVIQQMERIRSERTPNAAPLDVEALVERYEQAAPAQLRYPPAPQLGGGKFSFEKRPGPVGPSQAAVLHLALERDPATAAEAIWMGDLWTGQVYRHALGTGQFQRVATLRKPARIALGDLDANGRTDAVVADFGALSPVGTDQGHVVWLRARRRGYASVPLLQRVGRVTDVALGDVDGDGDLDVAVAVFGSHAPGVVLLEQKGHASGRFQARTLDARDGAMDVELADIDGDGRLDVVAALSQEHEAIVAYLSRGEGRHEAHTLAHVEDPGWGSMGIALADIDGDGDQDLVWLNGDVLDTFSVRPHHGVHLLLNQGGLRFERTTLGTVPGASSASIVDLDDDGDLDVVVAAILPWEHLLDEPISRPPEVAGVVWYEQQPGRTFTAHAVELGTRAVHATLLTMDFDHDGALDLVVPEVEPEPRGDVPGVPAPWFSALLRRPAP